MRMGPQATDLLPGDCTAVWIDGRNSCRLAGLAVIIVGERKDSQTYVRMKRKACDEVGIRSFGRDLPATATQVQNLRDLLGKTCTQDLSLYAFPVRQDEVLRVVREFNSNPEVHGILVQLPLPPHIDETAILGAISIDKDVDGFHPMNIGRLCMKGRDPLFVSCTPLGCIELLDRCGFEIRGKRAVVVGRSNIVGMPAAMLLNKRDATVTIAHSRTKNIEEVVREADIVIAAAGQAQMIKGSWIKPGAVVIDVGTNPADDASKKAGYRLVGDVDFEEARKVAAAITPVPGGVGPMTIAMLLRNTLESGVRRITGSSRAEDPAQPGTGIKVFAASAGVAAVAALAGVIFGRRSGGHKKAQPRLMVEDVELSVRPGQAGGAGKHKSKSVEKPL